MNPAKIGLAVQGGLSIVCATCPKYWIGRERYLPEPQCVAQSPCGSPLAGDTFSQYSGPMTNFERWCFRCGTESDYIVSVVDRQRKIGVCKEHVQMFNELRAKGQPVNMPAPTLLGGGKIISPHDLLPKSRKSLIASIMEVEKYYADKDGVELKL